MADHVSQPDPQQSPLTCLSDAELLQAYHRLELDDPRAESLLAEIRHRDLNI